MRRDQAKALEGRAHLGGLGHLLLDACRAKRFGFLDRVGRPLMGNDDGRRRVNEIAHNMVGMGLGMNDEPDRLRCQLLDRRRHDVGILWILPRVDQHHAFLGQNNRAVGFVEHGRVNVNAVFDLFELRPEILRRRRHRQRQINARQQTTECFTLHKSSSDIYRLISLRRSVRRFDVGGKPLLGRPVIVFRHFYFLLNFAERLSSFDQLADAFQ